MLNIAIYDEKEVIIYDNGQSLPGYSILEKELDEALDMIIEFRYGINTHV